MAKNYLEHETQVKFTDGILAKSQEWQWFINIVQKTFELPEVHSWKEYVQESPYILRVYDCFRKILEVCDNEWDFSKDEFREIWQVAKFFLGRLDVGNCKGRLNSNLCKIFFFCVWLVKLENSDNSTTFTYDIRLLSQKNFFQLINCNSLIDNMICLTSYAKEIPALGMDIPIQCLIDNLNELEYPCYVEFLATHETKILTYNAFCFQSFKNDECKTWQEVFLLEMLNVSFREKKVVPCISFEDGNTIPDISLWTEVLLSDLKRYFHHPVASFVIETVDYVLHDIVPSKEIKLQHCNLLLKVFNNEDHFKIFSSSSYQILSYLYQDKMLKDCQQESQYKNFVKAVQEVEDFGMLLHLKEDGYPVSRAQKEALSAFLESKFMEIENVFTLRELCNYFRDETIIRQITTEYLRKVHVRFAELTADTTDQMVALMFFEYMKFLLSVHKFSSNVDKRYTQQLMLHIQKAWQESVYEQQFNNLHRFSHEQRVSQKELEQSCQLAVVNPIIFANTCMPCSDQEIVDIMAGASENALQHEFSNIIIAPEFPHKKERVLSDRHDIDQLFFQHVKTLQKKYRYKFLNNLNAEAFWNAIYDRYEFNTRNSALLFIKEEELYKEVKDETEIELLPYSNIPSLAMVTQLFPVLEIMIRELVKLFGIFPFTGKGFMQASATSSLIGDLIKMVYEEQQSFENIADLVFIYNAMYNINSCNIRNECVHGKSYLYDWELKLALRITLFSIHMVAFRIKTIKGNVSDIQEFEIKL